MKADVIVKGAGVAVDAAEKVLDFVSKGSSNQNKATCDTAGKVIDASSTIAKSVMDATQTTHADVELTEEYKTSSRLDKIVAAQIKLISEDKMTPEMTERLNVLNELKREEAERKVNDENRASEERCKKRRDGIIGGSIMTTLVGTFAMGIMFIAKKKIK